MFCLCVYVPSFVVLNFLNKLVVQNGNCIIIHFKKSREGVPSEEELNWHLQFGKRVFSLY